MQRAISELSFNSKGCVPFLLFLIYWLECGCGSKIFWTMRRQARRIGKAMRWKNPGTGKPPEEPSTGYIQAVTRGKRELLGSLLFWVWGLLVFHLK